MSTLKPRVTTVLLYQGDDYEQLGLLKRQAELAARLEGDKKTEARHGDASDAQEAKDAYDAFVEVAAARALEVQLRAVGRKRFRDLMSEHPPRKVTVEGTQQVHEDDQVFDVNTETFPDALLTYVDQGDRKVRTITAPEFATAAECQAFLDNDAADGDYEKLWQAAYWLNRSVGADPKAARYSLGSPTSSES